MKYNTLAIVGAQWGDEGKGKMTDFFAQKSDIVVRFAGGDNAGHLIKFNNKKYKVTIIPSGIFNENIVNIIGNGCVVSLQKIVSELEAIKETGLKCGKLFISDRAHLVLPYHNLLDEAQEELRGENKIGTTKKGIGPTYQDKVSRDGFRVCDLFDAKFRDRLKKVVEAKNEYFTKIFNKKEVDYMEIYNEQMEAFEKIKHLVIDTGVYLEEEIKKGKKVLFEGAQGALLDIDHGTYPFVTSSNTSANNCAIGAGLSHKMINSTLGIVKAYNTRVGAGAFPTELENEIGNQIRVQGNEFGSNTGRPRRIGWLDTVALKYALRTSGIDRIFITLLDVLSGFDEIKICKEYKFNGKTIKYIPALNSDYKKCEPVFETLPGWKEDITKATSFDELPENCKNYLNKIKELGETEILGFSVGPDRTQTILFKEVF